MHYSTLSHSLAHTLHLHIYMAQFLLLPLSVPLAPLYTPLSLTWHPPAVTGIVLLRLRLLVNWPYLPHPSPNCPALSNFPEPQLPSAWQRRPWDQSALAMRNSFNRMTTSICVSVQVWDSIIKVISPLPLFPLRCEKTPKFRTHFLGSVHFL